MAAPIGDDSSAKRDWPELAKLTEWSMTTAFLVGTGNALQRRPPRNDVAVLGIHDHVDVLVEEVAVNSEKLHGTVALNRWRRGKS